MNRTNWLIIFCILASGIMWIIGDGVVDLFAFNLENLLNGKVWTVLTSLFLHADPIHLIGNMIFLYVFGNTLENELGENFLLVPFLIGGIASFLLSSLFYSPTIYLIGASAAIFTLTAIVMLLKPLKFSFFFLMPLGLVAVIYLAYNMLAVSMGLQGNISYIGHIIGFVVGVPFGIASNEDWGKNLLISGGLFLIYLAIVGILLPSIGIIL